MCTGFNTWDGDLSPVVTSFGTNSKLGIYSKVLAENDLQGGHGICKNLNIWKMGRMLQELASEYWLVLLPVLKCTFKLKLSNQIVDKSLYSQPFDCWWVICKMCSSWFMGSWFTMHSDCELMTSTCENDICYSRNPPPVLCLYTMAIVQIVGKLSHCEPH